MALALPSGSCLVDFYLPGPDASDCGNNRIDPGEACDLTDLGGNTCESLGYHPGQLGCSLDCRSLDFEGCGGRCGDGVVQEGEQCDGPDLGGATCGDLGFALGGTLSCAGCMFETSGCCGDGTVGPGEQCDDGNGVDWDGCTGCEVSEIQVNPESTGAQQGPDVAVSPGGDLIAVAWTEDFGLPTSRVWLRLFDAQGRAITHQIRVSDTVLEHSGPSVGVGPNGTVTVVFHCAGERDGSGWGIYLQRFTPAGEPMVQGDLRVNTTTLGNQQYPRVSVNRIGEGIVVWDSWNGVAGQHEVMLQRVDSAGAVLGPEERVYGNGDQNSTKPVVALADTGGVLLAWQADEGVYGFSALPSGGQSAPVRLDALPGNHSLPSVALGEPAPGGTSAIIAWQYEDLSDASHPVFSIRGLYMGPSSMQVPVEIAGSDGLGFKLPAVVLAGDPLGPTGRAWVLARQTGSQSEQDMLQRVDVSTGTALGAPRPVSVVLDYDHGRPRGAPLPSGGLAVVWRSTGQDGDGPGVYLGLFGPDGARLGPGL